MAANIVIASSGQESANRYRTRRYRTRFGEIRSRNGAKLQYTTNDAESMFKLWKKASNDLPNEFHSLLIDPTIEEVEHKIREISTLIRDSRDDGIGIDLYFAGHGENNTGNLVLKNATLSPTRFLELQAGDVRFVNGHPRIMGVFLDSCYSGAFLIELAVLANNNFDLFHLEDGKCSCLPDEECYEEESLNHGIFTYIFLHNLDKFGFYVAKSKLNRAVLNNDRSAIDISLEGFFEPTTACLTEGRQHSMDLMKGQITVDENFASVELEEDIDIATIKRKLTDFKYSK